MNWRLLLIYLMLPACLCAQRKLKPNRPILMVYGEGVEAFSAAMQSALSNVPTVWVIPGSANAVLETGEAISIPGDVHLDGGIWMKLLMEAGKHGAPNDSVAAEVKKHIAPGQLHAASQALLQKVPHLTVFDQTTVNKISYGRRGWQISLSNRKRYTMRSVVDASEKQDLVSMTTPEIRSQTESLSAASIKRNVAGNPQLARTTLAIGADGEEIVSFTAADLLDGVKDNFFSLSCLAPLEKSNAENITLRAHAGQALGAAAAYTAFFGTSADKIDLRKLQSELMTYHSRLLPLVDIRTEDPHFNAFQKIYLAGIFTFEKNLFEIDKTIRYAEIRPVLNQLYSRSQLWFMEHDGDELLWKDAIHLIKFTGLRGQELDRFITENWSGSLHFSGDYDPERPITRGEFAVLLDHFGNPYGISITPSGEIRR